MAILSTCIGSYPKPDYVPMRDWFQIQDGLTETSGNVTRGANEVATREDDESEALYVRATKQAIEDQVNCGVSIPTDGEQRRENYIHYHCRHLHGFDFHNLTKRTLRDGAYTAELPTIRSRISAKDENFLDSDFKIAQSFTTHPVKITIPGPTTIMDTCANEYYKDERQLAFDLADALNHEIRTLAAAGCTFIQVDEPLFARNVERALDYGVECLDRCFDGVDNQVTRVMHMCCGYPGHLDDKEYHKADRSSYFRLAGAIDASTIDQVSLEDAHRYNDLTLLEKFTRTTVIFGSVAIAQSKVESVEDIVKRLNSAANHIDKDRLIAAPDCGLAMLGRDLAMTKLTNLCEAASQI
ncbi:MAG: cobalamin-independent methionine synthase II family protein [Hyphomicrobiales bacterium]|nr:cobalamin-independent methionine synthase II family protein [Hyphomicrobiales bacterium]